MKKLVIFTDYYLPGQNSGGPLESVQNLVKTLCDDFDLYIICRDRDINSKTPYNNIIENKIIKKGNYKIVYFIFNILYIFKLFNFLNNLKPNIYYTNSFFSLFSNLIPLLHYSLFNKYNSNLLIAPRGEFSTGALNLKKLKKVLYIFIFKKIFKIHKINWQATSKNEILDIKNFDKKIPDDKIHLILNYVNLRPSLNYINTDANLLRLVFISRIVPKKNLLFVLKNILPKVSINIHFDIYGPIEDDAYWLECKYAISILPQNILCNYCKIIKKEEISEVLINYDLMILPTLGENFGHIIFESLSCGLPVLLSDNTPWLGKSDLSITCFNLKNENSFVNHIEKFIFCKNNLELKNAAYENARLYYKYSINNNNLKYLFENNFIKVNEK